MNVNFIFESDSLKFASPATISRMGIIYMNKEDLDTKSLINSWIKKNYGNSTGNIKSNLENWFENYFYEIYSNFFEKNKFLSGMSDNLNMLNTTNYGTIQNFLSLCSNIVNSINNNLTNEQKGNAVSINETINSKSQFINLLI